MEQAKKSVIETLSRISNPELNPSDYDVIKKKINEIFWTYLPKDITMQQAEALAFTTWKMVTHPHEFLNTPNNGSK